MMLEREARLEEAQEESSLALGRRIQEIDQQQREIHPLLSFLKTVVLSLKDELSTHNNIDCKLEDVKSKLKNLVNKLDKLLQISLQNRRDRCKDLNIGTIYFFIILNY